MTAPHERLTAQGPADRIRTRIQGWARSRLWVLALAAGLFPATLLPVPALAISDVYESAPERDPADALQVPPTGPGYSFSGPARVENGLRVFSLVQQGETVSLKGDGLVLSRLRELSVLQGLEKAQATESFIEGLKQAANRPVDFVQSTVADPLGTARETANGVGKVIGRITTGVEKAVTGDIGSAGELARAFTGQDRARRELALSLGVDPYTSYAPLSQALDRAARVSAAGSMTVNAMLALVPGGLAVQAVGGAQNLRQTVLDDSRQELLDRTRQKLLEQRIRPDLVDRLMASTRFTPTELAVIAYHLDELKEMDGKDGLVELAADAPDRGMAYAELRRLVLLVDYRSRVAPLTRVRLVAGLPVAFTGDGRALVALPLDSLAWTQDMATRFTRLEEELSNASPAPSFVEVIIPGDMTDQAAERLVSLGWDVTATFPLPDSPVH